MPSTKSFCIDFYSSYWKILLISKKNYRSSLLEYSASTKAGAAGNSFAAQIQDQAYKPHELGHGDKKMFEKWYWISWSSSHLIVKSLWVAMWLYKLLLGAGFIPLLSLNALQGGMGLHIRFQPSRRFAQQHFDFRPYLFANDEPSALDW